MNEMVAVTDQLIELGIDGWIHEDYRMLVNGGRKDIVEKLAKGERADVKRVNNYLKVHFAHIQESDGVMVINGTKNGIENYIGGNVLIELGQAFVLEKKLFLLYGLPANLTYTDEIESMDPVCLDGDLNNIKKYT